MVEKITVTRDEVRHYPWLDHTWVYVHYTQDAVTKTPQFRKLLAAFLHWGIKETSGNDFEDMIFESDYLFIKYDTEEIVDILKSACEWGLHYMETSDAEKFHERFAAVYKAPLSALLAETKTILEEKTYTYYFQSVDGLN